MMDSRQHTKTEKELKRERKFLRNVMATIPDSLLVLDRDLRIRSANPSFYKLFQTKPKKLIGSKITDILGDRDGKFSAKLTKLFGSEDMLENFELHYQSEKLGERIFNITARGIIVEEEEEEEEEELVVIQDITERKRAEQLYLTLANSSPVGVYVVQNRKFQFVNPQFQKYTGFSQDELLGMNSLKLVHPKDREIVRENAIKMLKGQRSSGYEFRAITKGGETRWVMETVTSIHYKGKRATLGNYMDITERKQAEEALRVAEQNFRGSLDNSPLGIRIVTAEGGLLYDNQAILDIYGYSSIEELKATSTKSVIPLKAMRSTKKGKKIGGWGSLSRLIMK
jgi:PAS domain S-box